MGNSSVLSVKREEEMKPRSSAVEREELVCCGGEGWPATKMGIPGCGFPIQLPTVGSPWPRCPSGMAAMRTSSVSLTFCWMPAVTCPQPCELPSPCIRPPDSSSFPSGGAGAPRALDYFLHVLLIGSMDQAQNLQPGSSPGSASNSCVTSGETPLSGPQLSTL